ncbi:MAG: FHA domain-containing protein [Chloroflexi bacterium]|nr:FHA domain-containing protein [Chloroflexota bacterium]
MAVEGHRRHVRAHPTAPDVPQEAPPIATSGILEIRQGDQIRQYALSGDPTAIGRAEDNQLVLSDPLVSRHHARLEWAGDGYCISDLGSANGTRVDGAEIDPKVARPIKDGDTITIGGFTLVMRLSGLDQGATRVAPAPWAAGPAREAHAVTLVAPPRPRLIVTAPQWTKEFPLEGDILSLGRDPANDIVIDDLVVSRRHAELRRAGPGYEIADLGSANGLTFQGQRVPARLLADGDILEIGQSVTLAYRTSPEAVEETTLAQQLDLRGHAVITIGRSAGNDVTLDYPAVSRNHARIFRADGGYVVEDVGSSNGTFLNGERVLPREPRPLRPGDTIRVGPIKFVFAPEALQQVDESRDLRLDALHLNQFVGKGLNLLQDISLAIHAREFVAVVGVSGAGKSTLLDALNGFRPAGDGAVLVNGTNLYRNFDAYRTDLGYVPQDDIIHKELTISKALDYSARLRLPSDTGPAERRQRVEEVMEILGLSERRDLPISRLSGGQRKRVSIGAELLTKPGLFFLDEATSGLDPGTESQMMRLLRKLADQGHTVLLVTHATKNVMLCDQVVFLAKGGHLAYYGPPEEALPYFEVEDFDGIYEKLENELTPETWAQKYRQSDQYQKFVVARLEEKYGDVVRGPAQAPPAQARPSAPARAAAPRTVSSLRQFWILSSRYLDIIRRDRMNLLLLFLIAPALGAIDLISWPRNLFDLRVGDSIRAMTMLFMGSLIPFLVGALTSVREIVKENAIYKRERTVTLKIVPYLLSKVWIGYLFAFYHAGAFFALKLLAIDFSHLQTIDLVQFYVTLALSVMSGVMWGLLISTFVPREEQAMILVIAVVVVQMVFSGGLLPLNTLGPAGLVLGDITSTKWVFQALTAAAHVKTGVCEGVDLSACNLPGIQQYATDAERKVALHPIDDRFGDIFGADVYVTWAAIGAIMAGIFILLLVLQKRKDVI